MAEPPQPTLVFTTAEKPKNLIVVNYECPPDPNHINHILESLIHIQDSMCELIQLEHNLPRIISHKLLHNYCPYMTRVSTKC